MSFVFSTACVTWTYCMWKWPIKTTILTVSVPIAAVGMFLKKCRVKEER